MRPRSSPRAATPARTKSSRCATAITAAPRSPWPRPASRHLAARRRRLPGFVHAINAYCYRCPFGLDVPVLQRAVRARHGRHDSHHHLRPHRRLHRRAHPRRRRLHHAAQGILRDRRTASSRNTAASSSATKCRPAGAAPAENGSASSTGASTPDIITSAKGLGNGTPIGLTVARPEVADALQGPHHLHLRRQSRHRHRRAKPCIDYIDDHNLMINAAESRRLSARESWTS